MRPSKKQFSIALKTAERMRDRDLDPHHLARVLRYLYRRNEGMEELLMRVDRFIRFGMSEQELSQLRVLVNRLREADLAEQCDDEINSSMLL